MDPSDQTIEGLLSWEKSLKNHSRSGPRTDDGTCVLDEIFMCTLFPYNSQLSVGLKTVNVVNHRKLYYYLNLKDFKTNVYRL